MGTLSFLEQFLRDLLDGIRGNKKEEAINKSRQSIKMEVSAIRRLGKGDQQRVLPSAMRTDYYVMI